MTTVFLSKFHSTDAGDVLLAGPGVARLYKTNEAPASCLFILEGETDSKIERGF